MTIYANNYGLHSRIWKNTCVITTLSRSACTQSSQAKGNMAPRHLFTRNHSILGHCNWFSSSQHWEPGNNMLLHQDLFPKQIAQGYLQVEEIGNLFPNFSQFFPLQEKKENTRQGDSENTRDQAKENVKQGKSPSGASRPVGWRWWDITQK